MVGVLLEHAAAAADQREREVARSWLPPCMPLAKVITVLSSTLPPSPSSIAASLPRELRRLLRVPPADGGEAVVAVARVLQAVVARPDRCRRRLGVEPVVGELALLEEVVDEVAARVVEHEADHARDVALDRHDDQVDHERRRACRGCSSAARCRRRTPRVGRVERRMQAAPAHLHARVAPRASRGSRTEVRN